MPVPVARPYGRGVPMIHGQQRPAVQALACKNTARTPSTVPLTTCLALDVQCHGRTRFRPPMTGAYDLEDGSSMRMATGNLKVSAADREPIISP